MKDACVYVLTFLILCGMCCLPKEADQRVQNTEKSDLYRRELDACYDNNVDAGDKVGYKRCVCTVDLRWERKCPFLGPDGGWP